MKNKKVIFEHMSHKGEDCIKVIFPYDPIIIKIVKNFKFARWSMENKCWYFVNNKRDFKAIKNKIETVTQIHYIQKGDTNSFDNDLYKLEDTYDPFSEYCSLFISYSTKDNWFARKINDSLISNGVKTFLWEKDALHGELLKEIMFENVNKFDRVMFIASENSLKSDACHYELTKARERQDKTWKTVLFPVHIDDFLFKVRKEQIRPINKREEYWLNILNLREIHSFDFSDKVNIDEPEKFYKAIERLLISIKTTNVG